MKLSIIIPVHNEEKSIEKILEKVFSVDFSCGKEVIIIDDGSSDNTPKILLELNKKYDFKLLNHKNNLGKGTAIKTGLKIINSDLVIIQDADLEYDPNDIPLLLNNMTNEISAVYGKRGYKKWPKRCFYYVLGAKILTYMINILYNENLTDVYTGYKLFNLNKIDINLLKNLKSTGFEFEAEITCKILTNKGKIKEVPITYIPRNKEEGKHIGLKDAFKGFIMIISCYLDKNKTR
jgi:glycosyltransferase involved in cell wall biosynthesis